MHPTGARQAPGGRSTAASRWSRRTIGRRCRRRRAAGRRRCWSRPTGWRRELADRHVVVLHVGSRAELRQGAHSRGAPHHRRGRRPAARHGARRSDARAARARRAARPRSRRCGISDDSTIVVYAGRRHAAAVGDADRVHARLSRAGRPDVAPQRRPRGVGAGRTGHHRRPRRRVDAGHLRERPVVAGRRGCGVRAVAEPGARATCWWTRARRSSTTAPSRPSASAATFRKAINIPFSSISDGRGRISLPDLKRTFEAAGIHAGDTVVAYCHVGQQATAVVFAARLLDIPVMLYDGSFQDWATKQPRQPSSRDPSRRSVPRRRRHRPACCSPRTRWPVRGSARRARSPASPPR